MKLLFDLFVTQPQSDSYKRHGGGVYGEIVLRKILELKYPISCFYSSKRGLYPEIKELLIKNKVPCYDIEKRDIETIIKEEKITRIYSPLPYAVRTITSCEVYGTVHGLRPLELPLDKYFLRYKSSFKLKTLIKYYSKKYLPTIGYGHEMKIFEDYFKNDRFHLITVSNHSAYSMKAFFPKYINKEIKTFYSPSTALIEIKNRKFQEKYFLLVSGNRWEKNCLRALIALDKLFSCGYFSTVKVKIAGTYGKTFRYRFKNPERFELVGFVDDEELQQLYHDAYCFIYPSLNEGFGYPPIEAMHYGIPIIASPFTSIPEVCGDAVLYTNPFSIEEIMNRILMINNENIYHKLSEKSLERYKYITYKQNEDLESLIDYIYK